MTYAPSTYDPMKTGDRPTYDAFYRAIYGEAAPAGPTAPGPSAPTAPAVSPAPGPVEAAPPYPAETQGYPSPGRQPERSGYPPYPGAGYPYPAGQAGYPVPTSAPRDSALAILLTAVGFFGVAGLQYFYIGKIGKGVGYLLTAGWLGIGTIVSLFTINDEVARTNDERRRGLR
ncbi:TM2 domain-containing protein [Raineyella sp. LH-20]|uniref:TM2 domain-containing protein n=1 Tax=Raineyella sp. LH-20 TaxID=3081204 RepID=UPI0029559AF9|nr:TM2 domain-containing protein [Raineyella sp. LH-20]WOP18782.1 TM2 domain-containing protein [Raineyella sp. LH-20]